MPSQTFSGKTGAGTASLGAVRTCFDVEARVTAITSPKVRQRASISGNNQIRFAGSYGLCYDGGLGKLVVANHKFDHALQDLPENNLLATDVFWDLASGVTATFIVTYA